MRLLRRKTRLHPLNRAAHAEYERNARIQREIKETPVDVERNLAGLAAARAALRKAPARAA